MEGQNWLWLKELEKSLIANLLKAQEFVLAWRNQMRSAEFWNISWLWTAFLMKICSLRIRFAVGQGAKRKLMHWVSGRIPSKYLAKGFPDSFRDGIVLCALNERLTPGACPRFDLLDPDQPLRNLKLALHLVQKHAKIKSNVTAEEILEGGKFSEKKLLLLVALMKLAYEKFKLPAASLKSKKDYMSQTTFVSEKCFARGMGLLLAVRGRKACFTILLNSTDNLDMVIEIRGPKNTACNKRITNVCYLSRSDSSEFCDIMDAQVKEDILSKIIPLTYKILGRKISVSYTPLESGSHHMSIIWQGQHIMGSPYTITVDSSIDNPDIWMATPKCSYSRIKRSDSQYCDESFDSTNERSLSTCHESSGTVVRKRILRYIVKIDGNDVVIDGKEDLCSAINNIKPEINKKISHDEGNYTYYLSDSSDFSNNESVVNYNSETNDVSILKNSNSSKNFETAVASQESVFAEDTKKPKYLIQNNTSSLESNFSKDSKPAVVNQESYFSENIHSKYLFENSISTLDNSNLQKCSKLALAKQESSLSDDTNSKYLLENNISTLKNSNSPNNCKPAIVYWESALSEGTTNSNHFLEKGDTNFNSCEKINENSNFFDRISYFQRKNNEAIFVSNYSKTDFDKVKTEQNLNTRNMAVVTTKPTESSFRTDVCIMSDKKNDKFQNLGNVTDQLNDCNEEKELQPNLGVSSVESNNAESQFKCSKPSNESESINLNYNKHTGISGVMNDDISFFPVHKVEYDILHDDDADEQDEFNPKRRKSFTELNECNYLEDDCKDDNSDPSGQENRFNPEENRFGEDFDTEDKYINSEDEMLKPQGELTSLDSFGSSPHSRRASSLFECEHSLAFWSETVDETSGECLPYEEGGNLSEERVSEMWENKLKELESSVSNEDFSVKTDDYADDETKNEDYVEKNSNFGSLYGFKDVQNNNASDFLQQSVQNTFEDDQTTKKTIVSEDLSDHKKRPSWSDREALPPIRESSVEGMLEFDIIQSEKLDKEFCHNKNKCINEINTKQKLDDMGTKPKSTIKNLPILQYDEKGFFKEIKSKQPTEKLCPISPQHENCVKNKSTNQLEPDSISMTYKLPGDLRKSSMNEDDSKSPYLSMNILSASPYKNRNAEIGIFESKFPTNTKFEIPFKAESIPNEQIDTSKQKEEIGNYILTFATPALIDECDQLYNSSSTSEAEIVDKSNSSFRIECGPNPNEQIPVQSLSVKKVIQIFQKEKEEPVDTWPTETDHSRFQDAHKKRKEVIFIGENEENLECLESVCGRRSSSPNFEQSFSQEIPLSSIKDRVKLFENDKNRDNVLNGMKKSNTVEKCSDSKVSARKNYWENMMH